MRKRNAALTAFIDASKFTSTTVLCLGPAAARTEEQEEKALREQAPPLLFGVLLGALARSVTQLSVQAELGMGEITRLWDSALRHPATHAKKKRWHVWIPR